MRGLDLNQRPSVYEPERSILSLADSVALTLATGLKALYSRPILCPSLAQVLDSAPFPYLACRGGGDRSYERSIVARNYEEHQEVQGIAKKRGGI